MERDYQESPISDEPQLMLESVSTLLIRNHNSDNNVLKTVVSFANDEELIGPGDQNY